MKARLLRQGLLAAFSLTVLHLSNAALTGPCALTPREIVSRFVEASQNDNSDDSVVVERRDPLAKTVLCFPLSHCSRDVVFHQKATGFRLKGRDALVPACHKFDHEFQSQMGVQSNLGRVSAVSNDVVRVQWNVTWVPINSLWLERLGTLAGLSLKYCSYAHLSNQPTSFSWKAVWKLVSDAWTRKELRIPLACIKGVTNLQFSTVPGSANPEFEITGVSEDLEYAQDLNRGVLLNRKCAEDLRLFLESGRAMTENWDDLVLQSLPWQSVPGSNPLDVDPVEEGPIAAIGFIGVVAVSFLVFSYVVVPELLGQPHLPEQFVMV